MAYSTYVLPILSFIGQLSAPPQEALEAEAKALRAMAPGPGNWCSMTDLLVMGESFGQARSFPGLSHMCLAAQKRVFQWEHSAQGGLAVQSKFGQLKHAIAQTEHMDRYVRWVSWYRKGPVATLNDTSLSLDRLGLSSAELLGQAGEEKSEKGGAPNLIRVRKKFQKCVRLALGKKARPDAVARVRAKLCRWNLAGVPNITANRCTRTLDHLGRLVPPRVCAAVWKTIWNGWTTARRYQKKGNCLLCCGGRYAEDSIEHYARCSVVREVGRTFLGMQQSSYDKWLGNFITLGVNSCKVDDNMLTLRAVLVYAIFRTTNQLRHRPTDSVELARDMVCQFAKEAVRGHDKATQLLDNAFVRS